MISKPTCDSLTARGDGFSPQAAGEVAGVDVDRAGGGAESVDRAGVNSSIGEVIFYDAQDAVPGGGTAERHLRHSRNFSLYDNPLPGCKSQSSAWTFRFAKST